LRNHHLFVKAGTGSFVFDKYFHLSIISFLFQLPSDTECEIAVTLLQNLFPSIFFFISCYNCWHRTCRSYTRSCCISLFW